MSPALKAEPQFTVSDSNGFAQGVMDQAAGLKKHDGSIKFGKLLQTEPGV